LSLHVSMMYDNGYVGL